jgi:hypothetical protein
MLKKFYQTYIVPLYHVAFLLTVVWAIGAFTVYSALPVVFPRLERGYEYLTGIDIDPNVVDMSRQAKLMIALMASLLFTPLVIAARYIAIQRRRLRHVLGELRECIEDHLKFCENLAGVQASRSQHVRTVTSSMIREHAIFLCGRVSEMFGSLLQCDCHTSLKSFDPATGLVATRARDALMHNRDRGQIDEALVSFSYKENTAFSTILDDPNSYMYISNYLKCASRMGRYLNRNADWRNYYSATVVLPVTLHRNKVMIKQDTVIGFLCVDTRTGKFNRKTSRAIILLFVVMMHSMMLLLGEQMNVGAANGSV